MSCLSRANTHIFHENHWRILYTLLHEITCYVEYTRCHHVNSTCHVVFKRWYLVNSTCYVAFTRCYHVNSTRKSFGFLKGEQNGCDSWVNIQEPAQGILKGWTFMTYK